MGLMGKILGLVFGDGGNGLRETVKIFRESAEGAAERDAEREAAALAQFAAEFQKHGRSPFDRLIDGINRLPRPALALGTLGLFLSAMIAPEWFAARMRGIALVPEPLWWLLGAIVSFYFGARHQAKGQEFQRSIVSTLGVTSLAGLGAPRPTEAGAENAALEDWRGRDGY